MFGATCLTPHAAPTIRRLAELHPTTLAIMHGSSYNGDAGKALHASPTTTSTAWRGRASRPAGSEPSTARQLDQISSPASHNP
jgi:hypothetical protein